MNGALKVVPPRPYYYYYYTTTTSTTTTTFLLLLLRRRKRHLLLHRESFGGPSSGPVAALEVLPALPQAPGWLVGKREREGKKEDYLPLWRERRKSGLDMVVGS